eukprot:15022963-Ditylum_brightwellii.AAC.1
MYCDRFVWNESEDITTEEHVDDNSSSEENNGGDNESDDETIGSLCEGTVVEEIDDLNDDFYDFVTTNYEADVVTDDNIELDIPSTNAGEFAYEISKEE